MIKDQKLWSRFESELLKKEDLSLEQKYRILDAMLQEARDLGVWPPEDPLEGIEVDVNIAKIVNRQFEDPLEKVKEQIEKQGNE